MATIYNAMNIVNRDEQFPINRRHQRMATSSSVVGTWAVVGTGFQSIGVTKEWRPEPICNHCQIINSRFQSIGVTKEWRQVIALIADILWEPGFQSIGVTKEWRQVKKLSSLRSLSSCFQSIGVTKEWRLGVRIGEDYFSINEFPINRRHQRMATLTKMVM